MKKVSIVILNWNGRDMLRRFLPSVVANSQSADVEVCVADNGSTDDSVSVLQKEFPNVRLVQLDQNYGFAEGYNLALNQIDAEYVVLLNSDVEVTPGWLLPLVSYMDEHPEVAACQPKLLSERNRTFFEYAGAAGGYLDKYGYPFCRGRIFDVVEEDKGQYADVVPVFWVSGAAMFIRLKDYIETGGLDGRFFAHMEEIDLCWRLKSRGRELVYIPQSVVYHVGGATLNKDNPRKTFLNFRNNLLMLYKNLPESELRKVMFVRGLLDWVAALVFFLKGEKGNAKAVFRARKEYRQMRDSYQLLRRYNLYHAKVVDIPERFSFPILWRFHVCGKKKYMQL